MAAPGPPATIDRKPLPSITQMTQETGLTVGTAMTVALVLNRGGLRRHGAGAGQDFDVDLEKFRRAVYRYAERAGRSSVTLMVPDDPKALDIQFSADGAGPAAGHSPVG